MFEVGQFFFELMQLLVVWWCLDSTVGEVFFLFDKAEAEIIMVLLLVILKGNH